MTPIKKKLDAIEAELGRAVFVVASAHERFFEPDEDAIRVFMEAAHRRSEKGRPFEKAALLLIGQGGHPAFAEGVVRALRAFWPAFDLILVSRTRGVATLLTFKAERVVMHPWASVGAYDAGPILNGPSKLSPSVWDDIPAMQGVETEEHFASQLARHRHHARLARSLARRWAGDSKALLDSLSEYELGAGLGLGADELEEFGIKAEIAEDPLRSTVWDLYQIYEKELGLLKEPAPRYSPSDIADEVEFEPAEYLSAGIVETTVDDFVYQVDTGRPHPETGALLGEWMMEKSEI
ncbi:hypothetical protein FRD01_01045 [Microvenator marinus]|uniref:Serine dehydrogenase proteinase n=1 Tax=Microvenator marinus TaxID=2600177 RepID=A0A5B8XJC3_9DELT|nr:hypothetical protein [Microvenator marinus]QED25872.1 hypothetical protein FRD01_01045 [Microvenator marinus]